MKNTLLALAFISASTLASAQCTQIFFSEYVEGSSHSKAVELYNPTNATVNLTGYRIVRYSNGQTSVDSYMDPTGSVAAHDVYVITNGVATPDGNGAFCDPVLYAMADEHDAATYPTPMHMNGDDAITLELISNGAILDIVGKVGEDPGTAWSDGNGAWWTANHTLIRKSTVTGGVTTNPTVFDPTVQWDSLPENTWTNLGQHACDCNTNSISEVENETFYMFPNPAEENVLIKGTEEIASIEVFNAIGENVMTLAGTLGRADYYLNIEDLDSGVYFIHITFTNQLSSTQRLIRK
jgi:predicted extracellular nuclease